MFIRDAGDGFGTLQKTVDRKNFEFLANRDVKTFEDLQKFIKKTNITPKEAAAAVARHAKHGSNWTKYQIIRSKSERSMIKALLGMEKKLTILHELLLHSDKRHLYFSLPRSSFPNYNNRY